MTRPTSSHRLKAAIGLVLGAMMLLMLPPFASATGPGTLYLRPHCELADQTKCPLFDVADPTSLQTGLLKPGDTLDLDLILSNPEQKGIRRVRAWLSYDTEALEGVSIKISEKLPLPTPGESDFDAKDGYIKISAGSEEGAEPVEGALRVARIQMTIKKVPAGGKTPMGFYDLKSGITGHTFAIVKDAPDQNILSDTIGALVVRVTAPVPVTSTGSAVSSARSSVAGAAGSSAAPLTAGQSSSAAGTVAQPTTTAFTLLQVQNVKVTTENSALYIAWDELKSTQVKGYNIYYGTQIGRYIQRRSLPASALSLAIRDLTQGTTYYAAVRAVNQQDQESAFSQEVAVKIGSPATSTAPLIGIPQDLSATLGNTVAPQNPAQNQPIVAGEAGIPSPLIFLVVGSAVIGTLIALRRQFGASAVLLRP